MAGGVAATTLANKWLDMLGGTAFTAPTTTYVQLHTATPGSAGTSAVSVGSTTRQTLAWSAASSGSKSISAAPTAWTNGGTSETLAYVSVWDASTAGNFLFSAALTSSQAWASGNTFTLTSLSISISPLAS